MSETPPPPRRVVVLGHTGFIGRRVKARLLAGREKVEVVADALPRLDLTDPAETAALAGWFDLDTAVILCSGIKRQLGDSLEIFQKNVAMVTNLCHLLRERPVGRLVFLSSAAVYGEEVDDRALREDTPVRAASYYGLAKFVSEGLLRKAGVGTLAVLRPPLVYGPGDGGGIYGPSGFAKAALDGRPITLWGDGTELREFVLVEDLAEVVVRLTFHDYDGVVNVASGRSRTYQDALTALSACLGRRPAVTARPRSRAQVDNQYDNTLLRRLLPDFAFTSLEEGVARTLDGLRAAAVLT
jgi:UDP-glucose 4-epimerase